MSDETNTPTPEAKPTIVEKVSETAPEKGAPPTPAWMEGWATDADRQLIAAKGWDREGRGPADLLKAYQNLERLRGVGADELVRLPRDGNEEQAKEFYARLGVPEGPDGYTTPQVEVGGQPLLSEPLAQISHRLKHTPKQHEEFAAAVGDFLKASQEEQIQAAIERDTREKNELEADWGSRAAENYAAATRAAKRFGLDAAALEGLQAGLGYRGALEFLNKLGRAVGEGAAPDAPRDGATGSPVGREDARKRLDALRNDAAFRKRLVDGDAEAQERWDNLKKLAFYGE